MKYCACYEDENWDGNKGDGKPTSKKAWPSHVTESIKKNGNYVGGEALQPTKTAKGRARAERQRSPHRRAVRRDEGAARRILSQSRRRT